MVAVSALVERALVMRGAAPVFFAAAAVPAVAFLGLTIARTTIIARGRSHERTGGLMVATALIAVMVAAIGVGVSLVA